MSLPKTRPQIAGSTTVPAPTGGLNAFNPISNMPETDAILMRNFFPEPFGCRVRKGFRQHATGLSGAIGTIMRYNGANGSGNIFAADQSKVVDVTMPGDYAAATPLCLSTNPWWQYTNMANPAGVWLVAFNGVDDGILWNGTTLTRATFGDGIVAGTWANINPQKLVVPIVHQHRLWAVEKDSTRGWYLPPEQLWGVAKSFDFGANFAHGGFLQTLIVYTQDAGFGPDDYLAGISSAGEVVLYQGIDPEDPDNWKLVGVFYIGGTFTRRCATKFGGDVAILTQYGMITLGSVTKPGAASVLDNALSQKIQFLISQVITGGSFRSGWEILLHPAANFILINTPGVVIGQTQQLVYNTLTKAWTIFEGMAAYSWANVRDAIMFGGDGIVYRAWEGSLDDVPLDGDGGKNIYAECQQAFSYFGLPGANKHYKMFRPTMVFSGKFKYRAGANMAFDFSTTPPPASFGTSDFGIWNESLWDTDAVWSGGSQSDKQWVSITGVAFAASIRIGLETNAETLWVSTDWILEKGGIV